MDVRFQAVFVFTSAWVEAKFKTTGWAHCVRDDRLRTYLLNEKGRRKLSRAEVEVLARAFLGLARMQPEFAEESAGQEGAAEAVEGLPLSQSAKAIGMFPSPGLRPPSPHFVGRGQGEGCLGIPAELHWEMV